MAAIRMRGLSKTFGSDTVVSEVELAINDGEFIVLLGPSGCGKTTVLRMVAGLESSSGGELWFGDQLMTEVPPEDRNVGMVFQNYALYPHMTAYQNLAFGLRARGASKEETRTRIAKAAALLQLEAVMDHRPKQMSGGQRQRVALGRAIVREPSVFLMDEPLSNLDANLRDQMRMELARLHEQLGITTLYVTHDQSEALTLASRVVVMQGGRIRQVGTPQEVYARPADTFVAGFIGSPGMNLWTLPYREHGSTARLGDPIQLDRTAVPTFPGDSGAITLGTRPEHLTLASVAESDAILLPADVTAVEHLGSHLHVHAHLSGSPEHRLVARMDPDLVVPRGERVDLAAPRDTLHWFDAASGLRLHTEAAVV